MKNILIRTGLVILLIMSAAIICILFFPALILVLIIDIALYIIKGKWGLVEEWAVLVGDYLIWIMDNLDKKRRNKYD